MGNTGYRLKGHETFMMREGWFTKGIAAVAENPKVFSVNSGADALGVGTNMAKAIRYWLKTAGVTEENPKNGAELTPAGKLILENDKYIEEPFTLWVLHCNIARNYPQATTWSLFFNSYPVTTEFTRDDVMNAMISLLKDKTGEEDIPERSVKDDCSVLLSMYSADNDGQDPEDKKNSPFAVLGLLTTDGKKFKKSIPDLSVLTPDLILYLIAGKLQENGSVSIDEITDSDGMPGKILNLNRSLVNDYLDELERKGMITINRTAGLDMVYPPEGKKITEEDVIRSHYKGAENEA